MGAVKSRLARGIGPVEATRFYRAIAGRLLRMAANHHAWRTSLWITPRRAVTACRIWREAGRLRDQGSGSIGDRMQRAFGQLPAGDVVLVGSDIPDLGLREIAAAFDALGQADLVFGPAHDGGFWLVGVRAGRRNCDLFGNKVRWSSRHALADVKSHLHNFYPDFHIAELAPLSDIDTLADYVSWKIRNDARSPH